MGETYRNAVGKMVLKSRNETERGRFQRQFENHGIGFGAKIFDHLCEKFENDSFGLSEILTARGNDISFAPQGKTETNEGERKFMCRFVDFGIYVSILMTEF